MNRFPRPDEQPSEVMPASHPECDIELPHTNSPALPINGRGLRWRRWGKVLLRGFGDVMFPPLCVHCREIVEGHAGSVENERGEFRHLCTRCVAQIEFVKSPHCSTCGHPFHGVVEGERRCVKCEGLEPVFGHGLTAVLFKGPVRSLVIELKYHRGLHVLADMSEIFRRSRELIDEVRDSILVPVPLHPRKARERGYNQAILLAEALARAASGKTRVESLLRRVIDTQTQTAFDRRSRMANLKNAFALAPRAALNPALHYILIDDVFTTGSTLNSCARALRAAGVVNLDVVTFGHG